jgi:hypothetical protein
LALGEVQEVIAIIFEEELEGSPVEDIPARKDAGKALDGPFAIPEPEFGFVKQ